MTATESGKIINPLPIELAPGVFWLGQCNEFPYQGELLHSGNSAFLVAGTSHSALIETAYGLKASVIVDHIAELMRSRSLPDIKYVCVTHTEGAHSGGTGHALDLFPGSIACGEVSDFQHIFPEFADRLRWCDPGESLDLGGTELRVVEAVFRDMTYSRWFFDARSRVLFTADGFAFSHHHSAEHCGHFTEDISGLDIPEQMKIYSIAAFNYLQYIDIEPYLDRLNSLIFEELQVATIAPTHGLPIRDPKTTLPRMFEAYREVSATPTDALLT